MLLNDRKIENYIVDALRSGPVESLQLVQQIRSMHAVSKEAVYKSLRKLIAHEVVVKNKRTVSLNGVWVTEMTALFSAIQQTVVNPSRFSKYQDRDSVTYTFSTLETLDAFWNHSIVELTGLVPTKSPVYIYCPHYWFPLVRKESERAIVRSVLRQGRIWRLVSGGITKLDTVAGGILRAWGGEYSPWRNNYFSNQLYFNIFEDFIITVTLDMRTATAIEEWFNAYTAITPSSISEFNTLLSLRGTYKLKITRGSKKAHALRKKLSKFF